MPESHDDLKDQLRGRYSVPTPVIRPIPARSLVAGLSLIVLSLSLFGYFAEYGRKELVPAVIAPVGGEARVLATEAAVVTALKVRPGQLVLRGTVLTTVSSDSRSSDGSVAQALVSSLDQRITAAQQELQVLDEEDALRRAGLTRQLTLLKHTLAQGTSEVKFREEVVAQQRAELERRKPLLEQGVVSRSSYDEMKAQAAGSQANALAAARELAAIAHQAEQIQTELGSAGSRLSLVKAEKNKELATLRAERARAGVASSGQLVAPLDGVVTSVAVNTGESVTS